MTQRDSLTYDVVVVGAGPAGLGCAIRLKQLSRSQGRELSVCVLEKGAEVGAHILSGAVMEPRALSELFPDWKQRGAPLITAVTEDQFLFLTQHRAWRLPTPPQLHNAGNYIVSLGEVCKWLALQAEAMGVEIYPGFAAADVLLGAEGEVQGILTGDVGRFKDGQPGPRFQPGMELRARQTVIAEGCRGSLARQLNERFSLSVDAQPQTYGLGLKEIWEVDSPSYRPGQVTHTVGWPLDANTYGGSWIYHLDDHRVSIGFVVGLDYTNPYLSPFEEFQRFKTHPALSVLFAGGRRIAYGARALNEGGWQSIPRLSFPGGVLIGDSAGFLNVGKIKGSHTALKSGMIAAESLYAHLNDTPQVSECTLYEPALRTSWVGQELQAVRNLRPGFRWGLIPGLLHAALDTWLWRGRAPWTLAHAHADHQTLRPANVCTPIAYPKPDGKLTFDRLSSVFLAQTTHEETQPDHLILADPKIALTVNWEIYRSPETRYCPAGVYEIINSNTSERHLKINAANCIHCKTCDIKDPQQNIRWVPPEGGNGPQYPNL